MAKHVSKITLGIDAAKVECLVHTWESAQSVTVPNQPEAIRAFLGSLHAPVRIAIESTANYHLAWVELALELGFEVFLVNPRQLIHYREAVNQRNKSDADDAALLARFLAHEAAQLRPYCPQDRQARLLWALLKRRARVVEARKQLQASLREIRLPAKALFTQFQTLLERIDQRILRCLGELGWLQDYQRCLSIPGIGPLNAAALVAAFYRGAFANSNAFIAYLGLDVRRRESGSYRGKRKLTKRGEPEIRRLLYCATQGACCYAPFRAYYLKQVDKGLPKIAARVVLARKLARIAFSLLLNQSSFVKKQEIAIA